MTQDQLTGYQETARTLTKAGGALALATVLLLGLTLLVATDRRRALIAVGLGGVVGLFLGGVFLRRVGSRIVDSIQGPGARAAAQDVFAQVGSSLRHAGIAVGVVALLVVLVAHVAGRPAWLVSVIATARRVTAEREGGSELDVWVARHADVSRGVAVVLAVLILFVTGIDWIPVAIVGAVLALLAWRIAAAERRATVPDVPGSIERMSDGARIAR